jgi:hypothetical protein
MIHDPMQALAYWLGYERQRYRFYDIREIAIVNELVHLFRASIKDGLHVDCEVPYSSFSKSWISKREKVDMAIWSHEKNSKNKKYQAIIEVKRFASGNKAIENDIFRIHKAINENKDLSGFIIACSPGTIPVAKKIAWINNQLKASRKILITSEGKKYRIRRIVHAYPTLSAKDKKPPATCFHVALVEVLRD